MLTVNLTYESKVKKFYPVISGFRREVDKNCSILGYYAASSGNFLPTFWDTLSVPYLKMGPMIGFLTLEDGIDRLSRNVGKKLPLLVT